MILTTGWILEKGIDYMTDVTILSGDCQEVLPSLPDESVNCCVTSPPYWGLRNYGHAKQIGQEKTPELYVEALRSVFAEVKRILRPDGTLWLNIGDSYANGGNGGGGSFAQNGNKGADLLADKNVAARTGLLRCPKGYKPKDLIGIPWMVAFALRAGGWYLRSDIIWAKPNCMPESVTDRPTRSHEYIFLFSKSKRYYYDSEAIKEPPSPALLKQIAEGYNGHATKGFGEGKAQHASATKTRVIDGYRKRIEKQRGHGRRHDGFSDRWDNLTKAEQQACGANKRDVWTVSPANYPGAHFATYPPELIKPCVLAGCPSGGTVIDPFGGSGTTGQVALELGRKAILIELNPSYADLIANRTNITPGLKL